MRDNLGFDKPFKKGDIFVYALLALLVAVLFLACAFCGNENAEGFTITVEGKEIAVYYFEKSHFDVKNSNIAVVEIIEENTYKITTKNGYNVIKVDNDKKSVAVTDADCGHSKECVHMHFEQGVIICAPHSLVIKSLNGKNSQIIIG